MDDSQNIPEVTPPEEISETDTARNSEPSHVTKVTSAADLAWVRVPHGVPFNTVRDDAGNSAESYRRSFRHNLILLLSFTLAAFILTSWILVRGDFTFAMFSTGPQEIARAQLRALDRGELRPAYEMFSARYRTQVSYDVWHELIVSHWRMFHAEVLGTGAPAQAGSRVTLEIHLRGADDKEYRAHFTLIRLDGRWWVDDVHWAEEGRERDFVRS